MFAGCPEHCNAEEHAANVPRILRADWEEMLHILTIAVRKVIHACIRSLRYIVKYRRSAGIRFEKGVNLVIICGFLFFDFLKGKTLHFICAS